MSGVESFLWVTPTRVGVKLPLTQLSAFPTGTAETVAACGVGREARQERMLREPHIAARLPRERR